MNRQAEKKHEGLDESVVGLLRGNLKSVGQLTEILRCRQHPNKLLAGRHREAAGATQTRYYDVGALARRIHESHDVAELLVTVTSDIQRRVPEEETREKIISLAEMLVSQGTPRRKAAAQATRLLGFTKQYVYRLLPDEYKDAGRGGAIRVGLLRRKVKPLYFSQPDFGKEAALIAGEVATELSNRYDARFAKIERTLREALTGEDDNEAREVIQEGPDTRLDLPRNMMKVSFSPLTLMYYAWANKALKAKGHPPMSMSDFLNELVETWFRERGYRFIMQTREVVEFSGETPLGGPDTP
jgi:hypothetical protein